MLKFTYLINFGMVGALIVPSVVQRGSSLDQLTQAVQSTDRALATLSGIEAGLQRGEYESVERILAATEAPFGGERQRGELLDTLRREIGQLESDLEGMQMPNFLDYLRTDPTAALNTGPEGSGSGVATTGLSEEQRDGVANIWPPIVGASNPEAPVRNGRPSLEKPGFTVDAVRQGRAYYRAGRYQEALTLFRTLEGEPEADYWMGRALERLERNTEAVAAYTRVIDNEASGVLAERAESDRSFLRWLIDFDRKVVDHSGSVGGKR